VKLAFTHRTILLLVLFSLASLPPVWAQKFEGALNKGTVTVGERFTVSYTLTNARGTKLAPPNFGGLTFVGGPSQSSFQQNINGKVTKQITYAYTVRADKTGKFTIGPAQILVKGKWIESNSLSVKVVKANANQNKTPDYAQNLFIRCQVNKHEVYLGEQLRASFKVYMNYNIVDNSVSELPDYTGFWSEQLDMPAQTQITRENVNGRIFSVATIQKTILFPQKTGMLTIDPLEMDFTIRVQSDEKQRTWFGVRKVYKNVDVTVKSLPVEIEVKPLPTAGKPQSFYGAVGNFSMESSINKNEVAANEAIDLQLTIRGEGNIKLLEKPDFQFPADFEIYDPKISDNISLKTGKMKGKREYKYLIIPRHQGEFSIDPIEFSYFNPETGKFYVLSTDQFDINVLKGEYEEGEPYIGGTTKEEVKRFGEDIRFIKTGETELHEKGDSFFRSSGFYGAAALPFFLLGGFLLVTTRLRKQQMDVLGNRVRKASKEATKRLAAARKKQQEQDSNGFYEAVFQALYGFLSDKLNLPVAEMTKESIAATLTEKGVDAATTQQLIDTLNLCEMARFAPISDVSQADVLQRAENSIQQLEKQLKAWNWRVA